jgi:hypothetical protein
MSRRMLALLFSCSALGSGVMLGCAHVETRKVSGAEDVEGVHFYRPAPYLFRAIKEDKCVESIVFLPDPSQEWTMITHSGLGTVNTSATLTDGWNLTQFGDERDSKIPETITAISGLVSAAAGAAARAADGAAGCETGVYKLTYENDAWRLPTQ